MNVKVCGKICKLRQSVVWYTASALIMVLVAVATALAEGRRINLAEANATDRPIREIATLVVQDPNPAPSIVLKVTGAKWCGPCKRLKPILKDLQKKGYSITIFDIDEDPNAPSNGSVPYLQWERFGKVAKTDNGFRKKEELTQTFEELEGAIFKTVQGRLIE